MFRVKLLLKITRVKFKNDRPPSSRFRTPGWLVRVNRCRDCIRKWRRRSFRVRLWFIKLLVMLLETRLILRERRDRSLWGQTLVVQFRVTFIHKTFFRVTVFRLGLRPVSAVLRKFPVVHGYRFPVFLVKFLSFCFVRLQVTRLVVPGPGKLFLVLTVVLILIVIRRCRLVILVGLILHSGTFRGTSPLVAVMMVFRVRGRWLWGPVLRRRLVTVNWLTSRPLVLTVSRLLVVVMIILQNRGM